MLHSSKRSEPACVAGAGGPGKGWSAQGREGTELEDDGEAHLVVFGLFGWNRQDEDGCSNDPLKTDEDEAGWVLKWKSSKRQKETEKRKEKNKTEETG